MSFFKKLSMVMVVILWGHNTDILRDRIAVNRLNSHNKVVCFPLIRIWKICDRTILIYRD